MNFANHFINQKIVEIMGDIRAKEDDIEATKATLSRQEEGLILLNNALRDLKSAKTVIASELIVEVTPNNVR